MTAVDRTGGKSPSPFAVARGNVNPRMIKEIAGNIIELGRKFIISVQNNFNALFPGITAIIAKRQRRVAVPVLKLVNTEPFGFKFIKAMSDFPVIVADGLCQCFNRDIFNVFTEVRSGNRRFKAAFHIGNGLVFNHHIVNKAHKRCIFAADAADFPSGFFTNFSIFIQQQLGYFGIVVFLSVNRVFQTGRRFLIKADPRLRRRNRFLDKDFFHGLGKIIFFKPLRPHDKRFIKSNFFIFEPFFQCGGRQTV